MKFQLFKASPAKKKILTICGITVGFVFLLGVLLYIFRLNIMMVIAPKDYAAYSLYGSVKQLDKDFKKFEKSLLGFDISKDTDFTVESSTNYNDVLPFDGIKFSYAPSANSLLVNAEGVEAYGEKITMNVLWTDRIVGVHIPEVASDRHFAVSSKNFGTQVMNTTFEPVSRMIGKKNVNLDGVDLSFSNITGESALNKRELASIKKELLEETMDFVDEGIIDSVNKVKVGSEGAKKTAYNLGMTFK